MLRVDDTAVEQVRGMVNIAVMADITCFCAPLVNSQVGFGIVAGRQIFSVLL